MKKAGSTTEQIAGQEAQVQSAEANVKNYQALVAKTILTAPMSGTVAKQDAKVGEIVSANTTVVLLISANNFEIEANIPEADIAKIKVGDTADVTLDAYGNDVHFEVKVTEIDPAETVIEGVSTYKTTFQFANEDIRVKSGLTANLDILTDKKENVIAIPSRAITTNGENKTINILENGAIKEIRVTTGLRGSDGNVEITSGISEG
ncbi:MAG: efflux RND transporter periplasmic adaptor subunit, partial [Patescibacteria group bacterium]